MKNNQVVKLSEIDLERIIFEIQGIPDMVDGVNAVVDFLNFGFRKSYGRLFGGTGYDYKAIYAYLVDLNQVLHIFNGDDHPGIFVRWDDISGTLVIRRMVYSGTPKAIWILEKILGKYRVDPDLKISIDLTDIQETYIKGILERASKVVLSTKECQIWVKKAFNSTERAYIVSRMLAGNPNKSAKDLYMAIGKYYAWRSSTPHMQWWNICTAERLLLDPIKERSKIQVWASNSNF
jgi:hypothetical protein